MAIGSGWQAVVAYVNLACYYVVGLPIGCVLGFKTSLGVVVSSLSPLLSLSLSLSNFFASFILNWNVLLGFLGDMVGHDYWSSLSNSDSSNYYCQNKLAIRGTPSFS